MVAGPARAPYPGVPGPIDKASGVTQLRGDCLNKNCMSPQLPRAQGSKKEIIFVLVANERRLASTVGESLNLGR